MHITYNGPYNQCTLLIMDRIINAHYL